jgi:diacylglycerol kinase (ATP)
VKPQPFGSEAIAAGRLGVVAVIAEGGASGVAARATVEALRSRYGASVMLVPALAGGDVDELVARVLATLRPQLVVACGSDALVSAIAGALHRDDDTVPLAIVPVGSGQTVVARALGVPCDHEAACASIRRGSTRPVDVLEVGDAVVLARIVLGRFSELERRLHQPRPWLARVRSILGEVFGYRLGMELEVDGVTHRVRATSVIVANAGGIGYAGLQWAPGIDPSDGRFDVLVIHSSTIFDYAALLWSWVTARPRARQLTHLRVHRRLRVRARRTVSVTLDGRHERLSELTVDIAAAPLRVVLPEPTASAEATPLRVRMPLLATPIAWPQAS